MKKFIFTLLLAIVSSVWTMSRAICMVEGTHLDGPIVSISGEIIRTAMPCGDEEPCADCLTLALSANEDIYYFSTTDPVVEKQLDSIYSVLISVNCICEQPAIVKGVLYTRGSFHYIAISSITVLGDIQPKGWEPRFNSLCDEWNVLHEPFSCDGIYCRLQTLIYRLTRDTLIQDVNYVKLMEQEESNTYYKGAMREGTNRDIYYVPANSTHEYLLYAFNAQVGDTLSNLWVGGFGRDYQGVVQAISNGSPRIFTIGVKFGDESDDYLYPIRWIEGVGSPETPMGMAVVPDVPADIGVYTLLCAYKNGEQVYSSSKSERYGCEFNGIPSTKPYHLCDEWNVMEFRSHMGYAPDEYNMRHYHLTADTIIGEQRYSKLYKDNAYMGAIRERDNRDIYYIPADTTHEYLLYAFNAQIGEQLTNLWLGSATNKVFTKEYFPYGVNATVEEITETTPRRFVLSTGYITTEEGVENYPYYFEWIEGIGFASAPDGEDYPLPYAGGFTSFLLCAYKNGEHIYTSEWGEQYGCEYNGDEVSSDTIPLYIKDNPGSSTVDPADPNLIYAVLEGDMLIIKDFTGAKILFILTNNGSSNSPARARRTQSQSFTDSTSVELTENGLYDIELTSEAWDYIVFGSFDFNKSQEAIEIITDEQHPATSKILRDGQLLIRHGNQLYTPSGIQVQ